MVKAFGEHIYNTVDYEKSLMNQVLAKHIADLDTMDTSSQFKPGLVKPHKASARLKSFVHSTCPKKLKQQNYSAATSRFQK